MDNVIDRTIYPLEEQEKEAKSKRRMGLGITGLANAGEMMGHPYASEAFMGFMESVLRNLRDTTYDESAELAKEKGPFPLWDWEQYSQGKFIETAAGGDPTQDPDHRHPQFTPDLDCAYRHDQPHS